MLQRKPNLMCEKAVANATAFEKKNKNLENKFIEWPFAIMFLKIAKKKIGVVCV